MYGTAAAPCESSAAPCNSSADLCARVAAKPMQHRPALFVMPASCLHTCKPRVSHFAGTRLMMAGSYGCYYLAMSPFARGTLPIELFEEARDRSLPL